MRTDTTLTPFEHVVHPFDHQVECLAISKNRAGFGLFMEMGTAKTKIIIDTAQYLYLEREIDGLLIVAPKGAYMVWVDKELPKHLPKHLPVRIGWYNADSTVTHMKRMDKMMTAKDNCLDIMCVNVEALQTVRGRGFAWRFANTHHTMMVVDESQCIKNPKAIRTKEAIEIGKLCDYRRILSGTPITKSPLDLYSQFEFLQPGVLGFRDYISFKTFYANFYLKKEGRQMYEIINSYKNLGELTESIKPHVYRKLKTECLDLPPKVFQTRYVEHTPEQAKIYKKFKEEAIIEFSDESALTSTSVLRTILKLHQINCGHVKDDEDVVQHIKHNRLNELEEVLDQTEGKVIIWAGFREDVKSIMAFLHDKYGKDSAVDYYGDTDDRARARNLLEFENNSKCKYFVSTADTGGRSLTLVQAATSIYYSYRDNLEHWLQSQDRNHRPGQTKTVNYIVFAIRNTVDTRIMKSLLAKKDISAEVLDNWREILEADDDGDINWLSSPSLE